MSPEEQLLRVSGLCISFPGKNGATRVVDGVSFSVGREQTVGLIGESGSGKTVSALAVMGLNRPPALVEEGEIWFHGENLREKTQQQMNGIRGSSISMIFQSSKSSLNPLLRVGDQLARIFAIQRGMGRAEARRNAEQMLRRVGIPEVLRHMHSYPHQLSGGMCQRVLIAMMVACEPDLLIADEPTTGLDVTVQAQIFALIKQVQQEHRMAMLLITHDLGVVAELCERMVVMYAGLVMEAGPVERVFDQPRHPYTKMLLESMLRTDKKIAATVDDRGAIEEDVYSLPACRFAPRCPRCFGPCLEKKPVAAEIEKGHRVLCHLYPRDGC